MVVDTHMTSTKDKALSLETTTQIQARLATGNVLAFSDLLKSMPIFFHLREEELRAGCSSRSGCNCCVLRWL